VIFFDIDGTLIDHASASAAASLALYDQFAGEIPFLRDEFPSAWERIMNRHFDRFCRGEISLWDQRRARIRESFSAPELSDAEADSRYFVFIREYEQLTRAYGDAAPCLERLAGRQLGVISNGAREQQFGKLRRAGLLSYFSVTVFSEDTGRGKPDPSIFREACRRAGKDPGECVHVGDDLTNDIHASHALGIRPVWVDRFGNAKDGVPGKRVTSLAELVTVFQEQEFSSVLLQDRATMECPASRNS
jgi:putative hydrolase of the HAD superfamily